MFVMLYGQKMKTWQMQKERSQISKVMVKGRHSILPQAILKVDTVPEEAKDSKRWDPSVGAI